MTVFVRAVSIKSIVSGLLTKNNHETVHKSVTLLQQKVVSKQIFNGYHAACMNKPI